MKLKLYKGIVKGRKLVGIYVKVNENATAYTRNGHYAMELPEAEILIAEVLPVEADRIIKLWNK